MALAGVRWFDESFLGASGAAATGAEELRAAALPGVCGSCNGAEGCDPTLRGPLAGLDVPVVACARPLGPRIGFGGGRMTMDGGPGGCWGLP